MNVDKTGLPGVGPYPRRGRIPGSQNLSFGSLLDPTTGQFLPPEQLRENLDATGLLRSSRPVTYCGGGIAASAVAFAAILLAPFVAEGPDAILSRRVNGGRRPDRGRRAWRCRGPGRLGPAGHVGQCRGVRGGSGRC